MKLPRFSLIFSLILLGSAVGLKATAPDFVVNAQNRVFDLYQILKPRPYEPAPVRVIDIDDESLAKLGQWPWPRNLMAQLTDQLQNAGTAAIAFDIVFSEQDRTSPSQIAAQLPPEALVPETELPDYDVLFAQSLEKANAATGFVLTQQQAFTPAIKSGMAIAGIDPTPLLPHFNGSVVTLPVLEQMSKGNGALNSQPDPDGILRRLPLLFTLDGRIYPSLAAETLRIAQGASSYTLKTAGASGEAGGHGEMIALKAGNIVIPTDARGAQFLYYSEPETARYIPAWKILDGSADMQSLSGAIVLVGTSAAGLKDIRATPLSPAVAGVDVFAQAIEQAVLGVSLSRPDWMNGAEITLICVASLILLIANAFLPPVAGLMLALLMLAGAAGGSWYLFTTQHLLAEPVMPAVAAMLVYLSDALGRLMRTERERKSVRAAFSQYMSPLLVEELAKHPEKLSLGGLNKPLSVMFCDMRNFTATSETLPPHEVTGLLARFLTPVTQAILAQQGTIDKYIGDCAMAFWNAPLDDPEHAMHAARAALAIRDALRASNLRASIGINSGLCCVGNMGTEQRFNYSALGDEVNLASRLQAQCSHYNVDIILGEATAAAASGMALLELDFVRVKGKKNTVRIFALVGDEATAQSDTFTQLLQQHNDMLDAYRKGRWNDAEPAVIRCRELAVGELAWLAGLYMRYDMRIQGVRTQPDWEGVFDAEKAA